MRKAMASMLLSLVLLAVAAPVYAQGATVVARLRAVEEVPAVSTPGEGRFSATIARDGSHMDYHLGYFNIEGSVTQAHLHFGQRSVNGGIMVFLCSNLGNGPAGTQPCPASPGTISGTIMSQDVVNGAASQGVAAGELSAVLEGIRDRVVYVNVHTTIFPNGAIRGQLGFRRSN